MIDKKDDSDDSITILDDDKITEIFTDSNYNYYMKIIKTFPILDASEINELHLKYKLGDKKARDK